LITAAKIASSALEARLNALVYQAYGLDEADIAVVEGYLGGSAARQENSCHEHLTGSELLC
jgi:hypothetical protein